MTVDHAKNAGKGVLIIGAGQAGASAASALRQFGFEGPITLLGDENAAPYERPPLSKTVLLASDGEQGICIQPDTYWRENDITLRLGARVVGLEPQYHRAILADGGRVDYEKCLLATGGRVRELDGYPVACSQKLHYVRTLADARALRTQLHGLAKVAGRRDVRLLVVGAGFLGLEVASTALQLGVSTTVLETGTRLLTRTAPPEFSDWLVCFMRAKGIDLRLGVGCGEIREHAQGMCVQLSDGTQMETACMVVAVGQLANTALAIAAGLQVCAQTGGILIDAQGRTSAPDVWAAGDCTTQVQPLLGRAVRLESWQSANEQARVAAACMAGKDAAPAAPPWFWTDMFGMNIQMTGLPQSGLRWFRRGAIPDPKAVVSAKDAVPKFLLFGLDDRQRLRHALAVNAGNELRAVRTLFVKESPCSGDALCDESRALRDIVRELQAMPIV